MQLTTGQIEGQEIIDIDALKKELNLSTAYKIFVDTIDENDDVFVDGEVLVVHIARSVFNASPMKLELVKDRVLVALEEVA